MVNTYSMNKTIVTKVVAGLSLAVLLAPAAASAHGLGFRYEGGFNFNRGGDREDSRGHNDYDYNKNKDDNKKGDNRAGAQASTTAARITKESVRLQGTADLMASMSSTLGAKISGAGLSASSTADANAKLADYNVSISNAKAKAAAAAAAAAKINAASSTTANASLIAEARTNLYGASGFLATAKKDLMSIVWMLWSF